MGTRFDRLRYEVFQNLILSPMNTGLLRPAVATVLTVYGIETPHPLSHLEFSFILVATVLTVYGIETYDLTSCSFFSSWLQQSLPFTVLKRSNFLFCNLGNIRCNSPYRLRY